MITRAEIDGVTVLAAPDSRPPAAGITFRVGYADERLARSGITHLIEHLALHRLGVTNYHFNGSTAPFFTTFYSQGSAETATRYLGQICQALADLPMDRLQLEKDVLRTEADSRPSSVPDRLWLWRHGSRGAGLAGYRELGLSELTPDDLRAWVAHYFTRGNAVLWFTGMPVPDQLALPLPPGGRQPLPTSPQILPELPAYFTDRSSKVGYEVRVTRSSAARMFALVLQRELFRRLRQENGLSYSVTTDYLPVSADTAAIFAVADTAEDSESAALGEFLDVLARLRWGQVDPTDLAELNDRVRTDLTSPLAEAARLPGDAADLLIGAPLLQNEEILRDAAAITPGDIQRVATTAFSTGLLLTPSPLAADWAGFAAAPGWSAGILPGQPVIAHNAPNRSLVIAAEGVSTVDDGDACTVMFSDCQAMLAWPDGGRHLIGSDGISCAVEPTLYPLDPRAIGYVDQRVPPHVVVRMPPRRADALPSPPEPAPAAPSGMMQSLTRRRRQR